MCLLICNIFTINIVKPVPSYLFPVAKQKHYGQDNADRTVGTRRPAAPDETASLLLHLIFGRRIRIPTHNPRSVTVR